MTIAVTSMSAGSRATLRPLSDAYGSPIGPMTIGSLKDRLQGNRRRVVRGIS